MNQNKVSVIMNIQEVQEREEGDAVSEITFKSKWQLFGINLINQIFF